MALHRDIYWVGRQWAVTGYGLQACDQKRKGKFDIEAARLWEDGLLERMCALSWLNVEDFEKALSVARKHYPEPPIETAATEECISGSTELGPKEIPAEEPKSAAQKFEMRMEGFAKLVPQWRIRIRR